MTTSERGAIKMYGQTCTCLNGPMPGHYIGCPLAGDFGLPRPDTGELARLREALEAIVRRWENGLGGDAAMGYIRAALADPKGATLRAVEAEVAQAEIELAEAWATAEAALPKGHHLCDLIHDREGWTIGAWPDDHSTDGHWHSTGPHTTPTAALIALTARLAAPKGDTE